MCFRSLLRAVRRMEALCNSVHTHTLTSSAITPARISVMKMCSSID